MQACRGPEITRPQGTTSEEDRPSSASGSGGVKLSRVSVLPDYSRQAQRYDDTRSASPSVLRALRKALNGAPGRRLADPPRAEILEELPDAHVFDVEFEDIEDASLAALSADPERVLEAAERGATSYFERMQRDHPDELRSVLEAHGCEGENPGQRFVVAIEVEDGGVVLLRAGGDEQIGYRHTVLASRAELSLGCAGDRNGLGIDAQLVHGAELGVELLEGLRRASAVEHLELRDRAQARVSQRRIQIPDANERRLVKQQPPLGGGRRQVHA